MKNNPIKYAFLFLLLVTISLPLYSQSKAGYLGKRHMVSFDFALSKAFFEGNYIWDKTGGEYEFLAGEIFGLEIGYLYNKSKIQDYYYDKFYRYKSFSLANHNFNLGISYYLERNLSPLGTFIRTEVLYIYNISNDYFSNGTLMVNIDPNTTPDYTSQILTANNYGLAVVIGTKRIIKNSIVISIGMQIGFTLSSRITVDKFGFKLNPDAINKEYVKAFARGVGLQNFKSNLLALRLSVGGII